jgi:DNA-binding GntR family transcriptional regulator
MAIESHAIRIVIERATNKEIQTIENALNKFEEALESGQSDLFYYYDELFHNSIVKATHNDLVIIINKNLSNALRTYRINTYTLKGTAENALVTHREILRAIKAKDIEKGIRVMNAHINNAMKDVSEYLSREQNNKDEGSI